MNKVLIGVSVLAIALVIGMFVIVPPESKTPVPTEPVVKVEPKTNVEDCPVQPCVTDKTQVEDVKEDKKPVAKKPVPTPKATESWEDMIKRWTGG